LEFLVIAFVFVLVISFYRGNFLHKFLQMKFYTFPLNHFITQLVSVSFFRFSRKAESSS